MHIGHRKCKWIQIRILAIAKLGIPRTFGTGFPSQERQEPLGQVALTIRISLSKRQGILGPTSKQAEAAPSTNFLAFGS